MLQCLVIDAESNCDQISYFIKNVIPDREPFINVTYLLESEIRSHKEKKYNIGLLFSKVNGDISLRNIKNITDSFLKDVNFDFYLAIVDTEEEIHKKLHDIGIDNIVLNFSKEKNSSRLIIAYEDNLRMIRCGNFSKMDDEERNIIVNEMKKYVEKSLKDLLFKNYIENEILADNSIIRSIEFPPEYHQAGLGILNYFSQVIQQRYPDIPVTLRIEQNGLLVRMIVETPGGHREIVEQTLEAYGLVVTGKIPPESLLHDPYHVMGLKHKLEMTALELRHARDMLQLTEQRYTQRIESLEAEVRHLHTYVGEHLQLVKGAVQLSHALTTEVSDVTDSLDRITAQLNAQQDTAVTQAFAILKETLSRGMTAADAPSITSVLATLQQHDPTVLHQVVDILAKGAISGTAGNLLYECLKGLQGIGRVVGL